FFPPSKTTNLRNEITRFQQRFDESFYEAWERFNDLLRACPHHRFFELHQLDTFYIALNVNDQDSLNSAAGGNFLDKMPRECLKIIESKSKARQTQAKSVVAKVGTSSSTPAISSDVAELKDMVKALLLDKKNQSSAPTPSTTPASIKAVEPNCVTCGGAHTYQNCPATHENAYQDNIQEYVSQAAAANYNQGNTGTLPGNTVTNPKEDLKGITTRSGVAYQGPKTPSQSKQGTKVTKDQVQTPSSQDTAPIQPSVIQFESQAPISEPVVAPTLNQTHRVPLILGRCFLKTSRALIDVHKGELTLRIRKEAITYNLDQTRFLLFKEADAFLSLEDDPDSPKINPFYYDPEGDILLIEAILNSEPSPPLPNHEQYLPSYKKELKVCEAKIVKSSVDEPPEVELKDLPPHL
nr:reverse transcriptase domain-containing protein [Tanacetum cinerariifolium]